MSLGILGFALSVVALPWNRSLTWLKWPRFRVEIFPIVGAAETYRLIIVNLGSEAITLRSIGLGTRTRPRQQRRLTKCVTPAPVRGGRCNAGHYS